MVGNPVTDKVYFCVDKTGAAFDLANPAEVSVLRNILNPLNFITPGEAGVTLNLSRGESKGGGVTLSFFCRQ